MSEETRRWVLLGSGVAVVIVLAVVALLREPVQLDPGTPEGVTQAYLQAISDAEYEEAFGYLDPVYYEGCDATSLAKAAPDRGFGASLDEETQGSTERPLVPVTLRFGNGGGLFSSGYDTYELFELVSVNGEWRITNEAWPYFGWECREDF